MAGRALRPLADHHRSGGHQLFQPVQRRQGHAPAGAAQIERAIAHAGVGHQHAVLDLQPMQQGVRVDVVEAVARGNVRVQMISVEGGERGFLAVEIGQVGGVATLLQQIGRPGDVGHPGTGQLAPAVQPAEALAEEREGQARRLVERLVHRGVDHRAVDPEGELQVDHRLQGSRGEVEQGDGRGHRLRGDDVLAPEVGHRRGALDVGDEGRPGP